MKLKVFCIFAAAAGLTTVGVEGMRINQAQSLA